MLEKVKFKKNNPLLDRTKFAYFQAKTEEFKLLLIIYNSKSRNKQQAAMFH